MQDSLLTLKNRLTVSAFEFSIKNAQHNGLIYTLRTWIWIHCYSSSCL